MADQTLELLSPWALQADIVLNAKQREIARNVLATVLSALDANGDEAARLVALAAAELPQIASERLICQTTDTPLSSSEVEQYDRYFGVDHVSSDAPGMILLEGLVVMLQRFLTLYEQLQDDLDAKAFQTQKEGLRDHVRLLIRVFNLEPMQS